MRFCGRLSFKPALSGRKLSNLAALLPTPSHPSLPLARRPSSPTCVTNHHASLSTTTSSAHSLPLLPPPRPLAAFRHTSPPSPIPSPARPREHRRRAPEPHPDSAAAAFARASLGYTLTATAAATQVHRIRGEFFRPARIRYLTLCNHAAATRSKPASCLLMPCESRIQCGGRHKWTTYCAIAIITSHSHAHDH